MPANRGEFLHVRRGDDLVAEQLSLGPAAPEILRARITEAQSVIDTALSNPEGTPEPTAALRSYLNGAPDPLGAAGLITLMPGNPEAGHADGLVGEHGLPFAADAIAAIGAVMMYSRLDPKARFRHSGHHLRATPPEGPLTGPWDRPEWTYTPIARRLRALLAAAPDAEVEAAERVLEARRGHLASAVIACYLLPQRQDWLNELTTRLPANPHPHGIPAAWSLVLRSSETAEQLDSALAAGVYFDWHRRSQHTLWTLAERIGHPVVRQAKAGFDREWMSLDKLLSLVASVDGDEAFDLMLSRYRPEDRETVLDLLRRDPAESMRALAGSDSTVAAQLLIELRIAEPELADDVLGRPVRFPAAAPEELPALLVTPPSTGARKIKSTVHNGLSPEVFPQVLLADGESALPDEVTRHLLTMLALSAGGESYPGLEIVARVCDRESLARFALAVFRRWVFLGTPSKEAWALAALGRFGDADAMRELSALVRVWPGESGHARAVKGLDALGANGSDAALTALHGIALRSKFKGLRTRAREKIDLIAFGRGLHTEQLADRLVPDLGLDEAGALVLDYGARRFTVTLDEKLKPQIADSTGKIRKSLPKPADGDDPAAAEQARKRFAALKKELRTVAGDQLLRLELAMAHQRTWTRAEFQELLLDHPLVGGLTRGLVWFADDVPFRITPDGTFADVDGHRVDPADEAVFRLAHPLSLLDPARWTEVFAEHRIGQPFPQLDRPVHRAVDEAALQRFVGVEVSPGQLQGLRRRGWVFDDSEDQYVTELNRPGPDGWAASILINPAYVVSAPSTFEEHCLEAVPLEPGTDPITASEIFAELTALTTS